MIIDRKHRKVVKALQEMIAENSKREEAELDRVCELIGIDPESEDADTLFDHVFNGTERTVKFK
jgi:hypothetical protein